MVVYGFGEIPVASQCPESRRRSEPTDRRKEVLALGRTQRFCQAGKKEKDVRNFSASRERVGLRPKVFHLQRTLRGEL